MKKINFVLTLLFVFNIAVFSQGYKIGDKAADFKLKNIDGKFVSLADFKDAKGFVVIFTCNHCPYAQAYQDRIIQIDRKYKTKGFPVIAINPNDPQLVPEDSYENMVKRASEKSYTFPYLLDEKQDIYKKFGAQHTPHVFLLKKEGGDYIVKYIGGIDDNFEDASKVSKTYLANAIDNVIIGKTPEPATTKAVGCGIKDKKQM